MRKLYQNILKVYFNQQLVQRRMELRLTQAEMSERLSMDERSYIDLDHGKTCCSAVTLALFIAFVCEDVIQFTEELRHAFNACKENVA